MQQIQKSLEVEFSVDAEEDSEDVSKMEVAEKLTCPAAKKPRLSCQNSVNDDVNSRQTLGNPYDRIDSYDGDEDGDDQDDEEEKECKCPDVNQHICGKKTRLPAPGYVGNNRPKKRPKTHKGLLLRDFVADEVSPFYLVSFSNQLFEL